jgi:hypothetical protein
LWKLLYEGFDPYAFVHDEILVQMPEGSADEDAVKVAAIKEAAMEEVTGHGVPAACKFVVRGCWTKP